MPAIAIAPIWRVLLTWLLVTGILDFILTGLDKDRALHGEWRISEKALFIIAILGGWWGLFLGMYAFHHKTEKILFMGIALLIAAPWIFILKDLIAIYGPPFALP